MDHVILLANPTAAGGAAGYVARQAIHTFRGLGLAATLVSPPAPEQAEPACLKAITGLPGSPKALVAVGGDGTVRLAAGIAARAGLPLGIVPAGTGNGTAYSLGLPLGAWEACRVIARGTPRPCDLGRIEFLAGGNAAFFLNVAGAGLDAAIARAYHNGVTGGGGGPSLRGVPGYVVAALRSLATFRPVPLDLVLDRRPLRLDALLVAIGNGAFYGKGIRIAPGARPSDGLLDVCVVLGVGVADLSVLVPMLLAGRHAAHPKVKTFRAREIVVRAAAGAGGGEDPEPVPVQADGDVLGRLPVRVSVVPGGILTFSADAR